MTGSGVTEASMPGQVGGSAGAGDDHRESAPGGVLAVGEHLLGHPVRRDDVGLVGTSNSASASAAAFITGQSESEPITIPTRGR